MFGKIFQRVLFPCNIFRRIGCKRTMASYPTGPVDVGDDEGIFYQRDITIDNIGELFDFFRTDPNMAQAHLLSENNIKAVTITAEFPWSTARTSDGKLVGCSLSTKCGDSYWKPFGLFVQPEYRRKEIGPKLFRYSNEESMRRLPANSVQFFVRDGVYASTNIWPYEIKSERASCRVGPADIYDPKKLPESGTSFKVVPFERGHLFDQLVYWDTSRVHWVPRHDFLKALLTPGVVDCYVAVDNNTEEVVGYGAIQIALNPKSQIIGPLYAENDEIALVLLRKLMEHYIPGNNIAVMHLDRNEAIAQTMEGMGVGIKARTEERYIGRPLPDRFKNQVYLFCNCLTMFY